MIYLRSNYPQIIRVTLFLVFLFSIIVSCSGPQKTDIECTVVYEGGEKISDSCDTNYYCNADISKYDENVKSGQRVEKDGKCIKSAKGPGSLDP